LCVSTATVGDLYVWALRAKASPKRMQSLLALLKEVQILPLEEAVARKFGEIRAWQLDRGLSTPDLDFVNAVTALTHGLTLVTHHTQDYQHVPSLSLGDWLVP
jgi:predicted nucleic acid-binding protein